jgi:hypothetical protein
MQSMIDDDFDFDQPVTRIPQNPQATKLLGNQLLQQAALLHKAFEGKVFLSC